MSAPPTRQQAALLKLLIDEGPLPSANACRYARPGVRDLPTNYDNAHGSLVRMERRGWVERTKFGRMALWKATPEGSMALEAGGA